MLPAHDTEVPRNNSSGQIVCVWRDRTIRTADPVRVRARNERHVSCFTGGLSVDPSAP